MSKVYQELVNATSELLGPASERFIDRQINNHLNIAPEELTAKDVGRLAEWISLSISMLTDDTETLRTYNLALRKLSKE